LLKARAPAKLNLTLEVLGKRRDGYHEVRTILQAIDLCDTLFLQPSNHISLLCNRPSLLTGDNTVLAAAQMLSEKAASLRGATIELEKRIPLAAGLGGGSSDGAAALRALNMLWETSLEHRDLLMLAERLGIDAPFFICGGTALGTGRGEKVNHLPPAHTGPIILLVPPLTNQPRKTRQLYSLLNHTHHTDGQLTQHAVETLEQGRPLDPSLLYNVFEKVAQDFFPGLQGYWQRFVESGASQVHLAGSGPALFTLAGDEAHAKELYRRLRRQRERMKGQHETPSRSA
jgi:4-diphosphocytidyl-2-C-methyl-D-erythritol kinase